jgi:hypothetical protein
VVEFAAAEVGGVDSCSLLDEAAAAGEFGEVALDVGDLVADGEDVGVVVQVGEALPVVGVDLRFPRSRGGISYKE